MYSLCSFKYMLANSFCAFSSFRALVLVRFFLFHLEAVFMSACFSLTVNVSHGTLDFVLCLDGMNFAATPNWALTKFSYSSFGVCVSNFPVMHRTFNVNAYLSLLIFTNPSAQTGYDTRSIFKQSLTGMNSEFSFT